MIPEIKVFGVWFMGGNLWRWIHNLILQMCVIFWKFILVIFKPWTGIELIGVLMCHQCTLFSHKVESTSLLDLFLYCHVIKMLSGISLPPSTGSSHCWRCDSMSHDFPFCDIIIWFDIFPYSRRSSDLLTWAIKISLLGYIVWLCHPFHIWYIFFYSNVFSCSRYYIYLQGWDSALCLFPLSLVG